MQLAELPSGTSSCTTELSRIGDDEERRGGLRRAGQHQIGADLLANVDVLVHHHSGDGTGNVVNVVEVTARRAEQLEAGLGTLLLG